MRVAQFLARTFPVIVFVLTTNGQQTPVANVSPGWRAAYAKAEKVLSSLTLEDKVNVMTGQGFVCDYQTSAADAQMLTANPARCTGNTFPVPSINFPGFCLEDSPVGVRAASNVSAFPAGINAASTFNRTLIRQRGEAIGAEFRGKGVNVALAPMMNLMRIPAAGRNWEGFGGDPFLSGECAFETITGMQSQGVQATAKHLVNYEQEHFRMVSTSDVDDRTVRYYASTVNLYWSSDCTLNSNTSFTHFRYLFRSPFRSMPHGLQFLRSVQADVAAVMCSYNQSQSQPFSSEPILSPFKVNSTYACENDKTMNGILKGEIGFQGYIMSDWFATHSTTPAVMSGLDMTMPGGPVSADSNSSFFGDNLIAAVQNGSVPESRIDDMVTRILGAWYLVGQDTGYPPVNFDSQNNSAPDDQQVNVQGNHKILIRELGKASTVLLKNEKNALPFKNYNTIGIIGNGAGPNSLGPNGYPVHAGDDGVLAMGWGSGTDNFPYLITPLDAITARAAQDRSTVSFTLNDTDLDAAATVASGKDVALVFITADSGEDIFVTVEGNEGDRNDLQAWHSGDALVQQVASFSSNTIVVVNSVGPIVMEAWIDHPNGDHRCGLEWTAWPGSDILYGEYNPSGRLPYTIGKSVSDYAAQIDYNATVNITNPIVDIPYTEGIFIDYRHFDAAGITPRFEFGFGLSFTTFEYSGLSINGNPRGGQAPSGPGSSLDPWLHDPVVTVQFAVRNVGKVAGHEIPQLYVSLPASTHSPPRMLKGFDSVFVAPGETQQVTIQLSRFDFSIWDVVRQRWVVDSGQIGISVGPSSRNLPLTGSL
ncbi:Glycoside hydrolase family 3 protein [Mycena sanguinolenta]|uniref:beta-glucosidase n=1 Tax=Mycena sanguinolenta TaxID=230812 RepID=A0A8H6X9A0_9AGAR|nr:Glycoside hydrolase family 3 protein [Mycena sanguinolenta]